MVLLRVSLNNIYGFKDFEVNFSYPRKIINSIIAKLDKKTKAGIKPKITRIFRCCVILFWT